MVNELLT